LQAYDQLKKVSTEIQNKDEGTDGQYNVVEIAKAAAIASRKEVGEAVKSTDTEEVVNRAGATTGASSGVEKRKAEELDGMDVEAPDTVDVDEDGDRAAKQQKAE
jgi:hypothetical protein